MGCVGILIFRDVYRLERPLFSCIRYNPVVRPTALPNVHSAAHSLCASERSSFQARERGLELTRRTSMQLTYMGNVYTRQTTVDAKPAVQLTYRRTSYDMRRAEAAAATEMLTYRGVAYQR